MQAKKTIQSKPAQPKTVKLDYDVAAAREAAENEGMGMAINTEVKPKAKKQKNKPVQYKDLVEQSRRRVPDIYSKAPAALRALEAHQKAKKQKPKAQKPKSRKEAPSALRVLERHRRERQQEIFDPYEGIAVLGAD